MNAMSPSRRWAIRIGGLSLAILIMTMTTPARAQTSTTSASFMVTANVINSCSFDSTDSQTLAIVCSTQTPVATSSIAAPASSTDATGAQSSTTSTTNTTNTTNTTTATGALSSSASGSGAKAVASAGTSTGTSTGSMVRLPTTKLCNFLAIARLENASFNQYSLNIAQMTAGPQRYYSTMQVCF